MKTLFVLAALFLSVRALPQDSIITRSGQVIAAKVNEVTQNEVKYRKPSNPDGPLYVMNKSEIAVIEYKNGARDVFQSGDQAGSNPIDPNGTNSLQAQQQQQYQQSQQNQQAPNYTYVTPRPNVNIVIAPPVIGYGGGFYRPYPRFYGGFGFGGGFGYGGGYGGGYYHHGCGGGGYYHPHWHH